MQPADPEDLLVRTTRHALSFLHELPTRPVAPRADAATLRAALGGALQDESLPAGELIDALDAAARPGLMGNAGPRFFGFVIGGVHPVALAADWLVSTWDQNHGLNVLSPALSVIEETAARWIVDLLGLPPGSGVGFVTGGQMANFTALAAARYGVLRRAGFDVNAQGLSGAPPLHVVASAESHVTIDRALRYLGLGTDCIRRVATDDQGRMLPDALAATLARLSGPTIVCAQAGDVNSGAFDRFEELAPLARAHGAWLHVDGAFGLWAAAAPALRHLTRGVERADSWAVDAHKWLNVPQDCGVAIVADAATHRAALSTDAAYLIKTAGAERDPVDWTPEFSRRARGLPVWAVLKHLGRRGVADLVERCCALVRRLVERLSEEPRVAVLNDVVLNQALIRFAPPGRDADRTTRDVIARVQRDGTCWLGGTTWRGQTAMRISLVNWSTTEADIDRTAAAILRCLREEIAAPSA
jgi:glutamate/tyrosine decarboxylase-like PLP-dependent enzyme